MARNELGGCASYGPGEECNRLEEIVALYLGRLNDGETIDRDQIMADHPDLGEEILTNLEAFVEMTGEGSIDQSLGTLGDYTLRRQIGRGGMGVVYEAWENSMDRRVALKVMPKAVAADTRALARFIQEAQLAGRLSHPNIVHVHGMGVKEQVPYYAMDFVEGETLAQVVAKIKEAAPEGETAFGVKDRAGYFEKIASSFADIADGLQHAHSHKIIHRDIKPSNLILDREGRLRILDFGLARLEGQESLTISGDIVGTPQYMSPEQARRKKIPVDHRTDVYSLGATLYEMLTLRPPFKGKDHNDTLSQIIEQEPVEPRKANPRVPKDLETIVTKCLRKDCGDRYGTAEALGQDLRRFVRGEVIEARAVGKWEKLARSVRRYRAKLTVVLVLVALLLSVAWLQWRGLQEARLRALAAYEPKVARSVLEMQLASLALRVGAEGRLTIDPRRYIFRESFNRDVIPSAGSDSFRGALKELAQAEADVPGRADAFYYRARALLLVGDETGAHKELENALRASPSFVPALILQATFAERRGESENAKALEIAAESVSTKGWQRAWLSANRLRTERPWATADEALSELIRLEESGGEPYVGCGLECRLGRALARTMQKNYVGALKDVAVVQHLWRGSVEATILEGNIYCLMGSENEAKRVFEAAFEGARYRDEMALAIWGVYADLLEWEECLSWAKKVTSEGLRERLLAVSLCEWGRYEEAMEAARKAIELNPHDQAGYWVSACILYERFKDFEGARRILDRAIERIPLSPQLHRHVGRLYCFWSKYNEAIPHYRHALKLDPTWTLTESDLGLCLVQAGQSEEGYGRLRSAIERDPQYYVLRWNLGLALAHVGRPDEAAKAYERASELNPRFAWPHLQRGKLLERLGKLDDATQAYRQAMLAFPRDADPYNALGDLLEKQGNSEQAFSEYLQALRTEPRNASALGKVLTLLCRQYADRPEVQLDGLVDTLEAADDSAKTDPRFLRTLAIALWKAPGRRSPDKALRYSIQALNLAEAAGGACRDLVTTLEEFLGEPSIPADISAAPPVWRQYFEGIGLERAGEHEKAAVKLAEALSAGSADPAVIWERWAAIQFAGLKRSPEDVLAAFPETGSTSAYAADLRWLLERLMAGEPIRINCGGEDYSDSDGSAWSHDRFFIAGRASALAVEISDASDAPLYQSERWFPPETAEGPGYRIPLPPGTWRVTLHFAEVYIHERRARVFDVYLERKKVREQYEPLAAGFAVPEKLDFTVDVTDGLLEIEFGRRVENPKVSAIEVERDG